MSKMTKSAMNVWNAWKPVLENERYGSPVTDFNTQYWASAVLENTMQGGSVNGDDGLHRKAFNEPVLANYFEKSLNESTGKQVYKRKEGITENIRTHIMEEAMVFGQTINESEFANEYSTAAGSGYTGTDTTGGIGKLLPFMYRRSLNELIAPAFMAVQPLAGPHGVVYTFKGRYRGNGTQKIAIGQGFIYILASSVAGLANWTPDKTTAISGFVATKIGHVTQLNSAATGIVRFRENNKVLIEKTVDVNVFTDTAADTLSVGNNTIAAQNAIAPTALFDEEAGYKNFFENYSFGDFLPDYTAIDGGNTRDMSEASLEVQELGMTITQNRVGVNTRKLKTTYPKETEEDLDKQTNINLATRMMEELYREIRLGMNREAVRLINTNARQINSYDVVNDNTGRWFAEHIMGLYSQIEAQAEGIFIDTRRGRGNTLLVSPLARVALSQIGNWTQSSLTGPALNENQSYAGMLNGKFNVHVDQFAETDYVNVTYKGSDPTAAGFVYLPYIGLQFASAAHPDRLWDTVSGLRTRYAIMKNPFGANLYHRYMPITGIKDLGFYI